MKSPPQISKLRNSNKRSHDKSTSADDFGAAARYSKQQWANFLEFVDSRSHTRCVFRGCGSVRHSCLPSIGRFDEYDQLQEIRLFHAFKRSASLFLDRTPANDWEWLALAQHYGLPTRLLDWTSNPLVACFFAVASSPYDDDAVIYAHTIRDDEVIDPNVEHSPFEIQAVGFLLPAHTTARIASQKGLFSVHPAPSEAWRPTGLNEARFVIQKAVRKRFRRRLFRLGIDPGHIRADLDGLCETLRWRFEAGIGIGSTIIG
ncbi:MAG: FRG domain-containing protein [Amphiplicatus sp.]